MEVHRALITKGGGDGQINFEYYHYQLRIYHHDIILLM